ncbi:integrase, partial [Escherichia coli]
MGRLPVQLSFALQWHCCKVSDEAAFCLIQRPYISKTLLTRRISPRG